MIGRKGPGPERPGPDYPPEWDREPEEPDREEEAVAAVAEVLDHDSLEGIPGGLPLASAIVGLLHDAGWELVHRDEWTGPEPF